ncbi:COA8 family protein CG14806, mitochondrial [Episyrphus balteatus]|uniref:COA8 family protein CG14806, mitochondrial n=1 Tax=Episyrphus balteatus TaxID=286459 RepID=UPI00248565CC|nr:COA8 family protein CG14806, mitochondrial [Episyrphus balteatus]
MIILRKTRNFARISNIRNFADKTKPATTIGLAEKPAPESVTSDYIGPPDKESNLRPYVRCIPKNETPLATELRLKQIEVEKWNQEFWAKHNKRFYDEREDFIRMHKDAGIDELSADKMSEFYKTFLDKNKKMHLYYNISWYLKNFDLLVLAGQVNVQKLFTKLQK